MTAPKYTTADADIDARNYHANEDRKERARQAFRDRIAQTLVALLSALAAVATAYCAARYGIDKLEAGSASYTIAAVKTTASSPGTALKINSKTGDTWMLVTGKAGPVWQKVP